MHPPHFKPTSKELRLFTLVLLIPAAVLHFSFHYTTAAIVLASYASLGLLIPTLAKPLHKLLVVITWPIGFCLNHLLLATIYYLLVTPSHSSSNCAAKSLSISTTHRNPAATSPPWKNATLHLTTTHSEKPYGHGSAPAQRNNTHA